MMIIIIIIIIVVVVVVVLLLLLLLLLLIIINIIISTDRCHYLCNIEDLHDFTYCNKKVKCVCLFCLFEIHALPIWHAQFSGQV